MRINEILSESRLQDITLTKLHSILPEYSQALASEPIWRGLDHPDDPFTFKLAISSQHERAAANTNNHSNMVVSNSPAWAAYPQRNKAFICTSDANYAGAYGSVYRILPRNGTTLGVCPSIDFWESFPNLLKHKMDFLELNEALGGMDRARLPDSNYMGFKQHLDSLEPEKFYRDEQTERLYHVALEMGVPVSDTFERLLDPKANGFKIQNINGFNTSGREVWFTGEALVVHPDYLDQIT